jgi:hypothetical protein
MRLPRFTSRNRSKELFGWIAYLDIFGFRGHLESDFFPESENKLLDMHEALRRDPVFSKAASFFMFSDSVVLWDEISNADDDALRRFIDRVAIAQRTAAQFDFLLRGSLAYGRILLSANYILGNAYLRAYTYESANLLNPIVAIPQSELKAANVRDLFEADLKEIILKGGVADHVMTLNFVPWDQIQRIKAANIAAIMSSDPPKRDELVARWQSIQEK